MALPPKEWKAFDEQIEILRARGMVVDDQEYARHFLKRVGYYRLSGYSYPFRKFAEDGEGRVSDFVAGSRFEDVVALYLFDRKLRLLALDAVERIELAIQVDIAYLIGNRDQFAHENPAELHGNFWRAPRRGGPSDHEKWLEDYQRQVLRAKRKPFVAHNLEKYGRLPIWVAIEVLDFGTLSKLYSGLKQPDKVKIEAQFGLNEGKHLHSWLRGLNFIRNTAAHHSRLWNCNVLERASVPTHKLQMSGLENSRSFLYFCIMQTMMRVVCPQSDWGNRFKQLLETFPKVENGAVDISQMGAVDGWEGWAMWK